MSNLIQLSAERLMKLEAEIRAALEFGPNEADTRLKVLDRFLFEVLDWQRDTSVEAEPPTESGYIDYLLKIGENRGAMVVEAKRKGKLEPATKQSDVLNVTLSGPVVQPMMSGIKQAMTYAMEQGVAVACVTGTGTLGCSSRPPGQMARSHWRAKAYSSPISPLSSPTLGSLSSCSAVDQSWTASIWLTSMRQRA